MTVLLPRRGLAQILALIVILAALVGGILACGGVLLREAIDSRQPLPEPVLE